MSSDYSPPVFVTKDTNGNYVVTLASGLSFTVKDHSGTAIFTATDGSPDTAKLGVGLQVYAGTAAASITSKTLLSADSTPDAILGTDGSANIYIVPPGGPDIVLSNAVGAQNFSVIGSTGVLRRYANIAVAGLGVAPIYQVGHGVGATTTQTVTYTPPATAGCYIVSVLVQVTTAGTSTIPTLSYHDASGNTVTSQAMSMKQVTTTSAPVTSITATGYWAYDYPVSVDNSGSPITVVITPTGSTFNYEVFIRQVR